MDCFLGILCLLIFFMIYYFLGYSISTKKSFSSNVLCGYFTYSFFVSIGLIVIQVFFLPWKFSLIYFLSIMLSFLIFIGYKMKKHPINISKIEVKDFLKNHYMLFLVLGVLTILLLCNVRTLWLNNHLDDGYYLGKIFQYPLLSDPYSVDYSTGINIERVFDARSFNTWELEASIITYLFKIDVFVYTRFFLAINNYFILILIVYEFSKQMFIHVKKDYNRNYAQFATLVLILLSFAPEVTRALHVMDFHDQWQYGSAMYYGSSLIRTSCFLFIILLFLKNNKVDLKNIFLLMCVGVVYISKSTIAVPTLIISSISVYCAIYLFNKKRYLIFLVLGITLLAGIVLPNNLEIEISIMQNFKLNALTFAFLVSIVFCLYGFTLKNKYI